MKIAALCQLGVNEVQDLREWLAALGKNAVPGSISLSFSWPNQNLDSTVISKRYRDKCFRKAENHLNPILPKGFDRPPSANHGFKLEHVEIYAKIKHNIGR
jgi:hypothetical protein